MLVYAYGTCVLVNLSLYSSFPYHILEQSWELAPLCLSLAVNFIMSRHKEFSETSTMFCRTIFRSRWRNNRSVSFADFNCWSVSFGSIYIFCIYRCVNFMWDSWLWFWQYEMIPLISDVLWPNFTWGLKISIEDRFKSWDYLQTRGRAYGSGKQDTCSEV